MNKTFTLPAKWILPVFFVLLCATSGYAQQIRITGTVTDAERDEPLIGAIVLDIDTKKGATTDANGKYTISVDSYRSQLSFSFLGKETQIVQVGNRSVINVVMNDEATTLESVVLSIGYGTMIKSDLTGAVATLKGTEVAESGVTSFTSALAGRLSGVQGIQNGGAPGSAISLKVRGASSVSAGSDPLYVIDGIIMDNSSAEIIAANRRGDESLDPMAMINPNDIQSIEVLKDASATAIYGSRGANGVILITTKSGTKDGTTRINFSSDWSFGFRPQKQIEMLDGSEYEEYRRFKIPLPADFVPDVTVLTDDQKKWWNADGTPKTSGVNRNYQNEILKNGALSQNYNISVRGSGKGITYLMSGGYLNQNGLAIGSDMTRFTFNSRIESTFNKYLRIGMNLGGSNVVNNGVIAADSQTNGGIFTQMMVFRPDASEEEIDATGIDLDDPASGQYNPVRNVEQVVQNTISRRMQGRAYAIVNPIKNVSIETSFGGYTTDVKSKNNYPSDTGPGRVDKGKIIHGSSRRLNWLNENTISYKNTFCKKHRLDVVGGLTFQKTVADEISITGTEMQISDLGVESLKYAGILSPTANNYTESMLMSYLARVNYDYANRYSITASIRADGSSKFPKGNKFAYFPSGAVAWRISEEQFLKSTRWIDMLKLRLSYGQTGNQGIPTLSSLAVLNNVYYSFNTQQGGKGSPVLNIGLNPGQIGNPDLRWETTEMYNVGLDFNVIRSRINFTFEAYYKYTRDLLINMQLPSYSGYERVMKNIGSVSNRGLEFSVSTVNVSTRHFKWMTDLNLTMNRNRVEDIGYGTIQVTPTAIMQGHYLNVFQVRNGLPLGAMFGYRTDGLYQLQDFTQFYDANGVFITDPAQQKAIYEQSKGNFTLVSGIVDRGDNPEPGYVKFTNPDEMEYIGSSEPLFFGGFTNRFHYKNFELSVFMTYSYGNKLFNASHGILRGRSQYNIERDYYYNMWTVDRQDGKYHHYQDGNGRQYATDNQVEDASYIKFKDIQLSYNLPPKVCRRFGAQNARIYVSAKNAFTITNYSWYDPEYASNDPLKAGLDKFSYPAPRTFMFGVNMNF